MKRILHILFLLLLTGFAATAQRPPAISSPEVHPDHSITFRYFSRKAQKVSVSGEFLTAPVAMTKDTGGIWSVTVPPVKPDIYPYSFWVDTVQIADPN
ncbi:MAG TPA: esterase, partial [Haliscomenobacter sp.]|nr:esterase [Haliscomenobacter sp.]